MPWHTTPNWLSEFAHNWTASLLSKRKCLVVYAMACGVNKDNLIVRIDPEKQNALLKKPHAKPFDLTGRPMKGWLVIEAEGCKTDKQLSEWVKEGTTFALTLPPK